MWQRRKVHWPANLFPPFSYVRSLVNMTRASLWIYFLTNDLAHRERIKTSEKKMSNEMTRENFTYKRSNKYRGIVNATFNMLSVVSCGKNTLIRKENSTNSIQFANLIASRSTLKPDNIFRSKSISFFFFPSHFILLQPLSHVPPITSSSYFVFRFRALPSLYTTLFHLLFHVILCSLHTTAPQSSSPHITRHSLSFSLYIFFKLLFSLNLGSPLSHIFPPSTLRPFFSPDR